MINKNFIGGVGMVLSAGVIVVRREDGEWYYLLLRAFGYWDFPKGIVEEGEDPLDAAIREVEEETGINDLTFHWGPVYKESAPYLGGRKKARYYVAETKTKDVELRVNPELGHPEHDAYRWVDFDEAMAMLAERVKPCITWARDLIESQPPGAQDMDEGR
ncbi:MAG TPA: NUDIX domain-containing protein [Dissulfuribacter thermophilus]|uniref:Bis(5'-nucleosyl)-tetraphosphatase [asymmetrical] n=1 Tax=Dissulfuribacter thermophilus TaxID=1156395 RepID=A0A7V2WTD9_9BACT|nr:NUDIX domain-containing protein [Dissulfuribacter thermophilus]